MSTPTMKGLHHLKLPVTDLERSTAWYGRVLGLHHQPQLDHVDEQGIRFAVILAVPGSDVPLELRWAPGAVPGIAGYDPISFAAGTVADVEQWAAHLDTEGVEHSTVLQGGAGAMLVLRDPDGTFLRLVELPEGGVAGIELGDHLPESTGPWLAPPTMRHPGQPGYEDGGLG